MQPGGCAHLLRLHVWSNISGLIRFIDGCDSDSSSDFVHILAIREVAGEERVSHTWVYQWKSPNSPRPKSVIQVNSKVKTMLISFFDVKGIDCSQGICHTRPESQFCTLL
jgi:hypothetical protein